MRKAKPGQVLVEWSRPERGEPHDICFSWGGREGDLVSTKRDGGFIHWKLFSSEMIKELEDRGFDTKTIKFSIMKKPGEPG